MKIVWRLIVIAGLIWFCYHLWADDLSFFGLVFITILIVKEMVNEVGELVDMRTDYWIEQKRIQINRRDNP